MNIRFVLQITDTKSNVLAEMHDMREVPAKGDLVHIEKERYEVLKRSWYLAPRNKTPDMGGYRDGYRDGYPEACTVTVYVRRGC